MKNFLLAFFLIFISIQIFSQEHLKFSGIFIDGNVEVFVRKLENKGYKFVDYINTVAVLEGKFTGKDANIFVLSSPKTKTVWKVAVEFDESNSWNYLKFQYEDYKEAYTQKYGEPSSVHESFYEPYYEGDGLEIQALKLERCHYASYYYLDNGIIYVGLTEFCTLNLEYEDKINLKVMEKESRSSITEDI